MSPSRKEVALAVNWTVLDPVKSLLPCTIGANAEHSKKDKKMLEMQ
jgi:hypothetical protein